MHRGIQAALRDAEDPSVRAVVITGAGRGFCVGQDLQEFSSGAGDVAENLRQNYHRNVLAIRALEKPVIAAVNGPAAGAGMSSGARVRRAHRRRQRELRAGVHQHRPRPGLRRHVARAPAARCRPRLRVADDRPPSRRRGGADVGPRLGGRAGRRARAPHTRGRRALRRDADARRLAHEAPARRRAGDDLRRAARARGGHAGRDDADPRLHGGRRRIPRQAGGGVHRRGPRAAAPDHDPRRRRPASLATDDGPAARARAAAPLPGRVLGLRRPASSASSTGSSRSSAAARRSPCTSGSRVMRGTRPT